MLINARGNNLHLLKYSGAIQIQPLSSGALHQGLLGGASSSAGAAAAFSASYSSKLKFTSQFLSAICK